MVLKSIQIIYEVMIMASREDLVEVFDDTEYWCKHDEKLEAAIMDSILWQRPTRRFLQNLMACSKKCILRCTAAPRDTRNFDAFKKVLG